MIAYDYPSSGRVTCERLRFRVHDHRDSFDARCQGECKGALHGITSQFGFNSPLVVRLGDFSQNTI